MNQGAPRVVRVAAGLDAPYPEPSSANATAIGKANRRCDTKPERMLRSELHRRGLSFRKDHLVRVVGARSRVDICFTRAKVAVFVDGCFWHACPIHHNPPRRNSEYWGPKFAANVARDRRVDAALKADGWKVLRVWEHEEPCLAADRVQGELTQVRSQKQ